MLPGRSCLGNSRPKLRYVLLLFLADLHYNRVKLYGCCVSLRRLCYTDRKQVAAYYHNFIVYLDAQRIDQFCDFRVIRHDCDALLHSCSLRDQVYWLGHLGQ